MGQGAQEGSNRRPLSVLMLKLSTDGWMGQGAKEGSNRRPLSVLMLKLSTDG